MTEPVVAKNETMDWIVDRVCGTLRTKLEIMLLAAKKQIYTPNAAAALVRQKTLHELYAEFEALWTMLALCADMPADIKTKHAELLARERQNADALVKFTNNILVADTFSVRSRNCLQKMGIHTLGDLARTTEEEILASKNFGETSLGEIKEVLADYGLALGSLPRKPAHISELHLSLHSTKAMNKFGFKTVDELTRMSAADLLECRNFGPVGLNEIRAKLAAHGLALKGERASDFTGQFVQSGQRKKIVR